MKYMRLATICIIIARSHHYMSAINYGSALNSSSSYLPAALSYLPMCPDINLHISCVYRDQLPCLIIVIHIPNLPLQIKSFHIYLPYVHTRSI